MVTSGILVTVSLHLARCSSLHQGLNTGTWCRYVDIRVDICVDVQISVTWRTVGTSRHTRRDLQLHAALVVAGARTQVCSTNHRTVMIPAAANQSQVLL